MTDATDTDRSGKEAMQQPGTQAAQGNEMQKDTAGAPAQDRQGAAQNDGATKPELESPARENLERVGVDAEHKTEAMRKGQRGTFP